MLDCEFTVAAGPHARRKFWQMFTVAGGKVDEHGVSIGWKISKGTFRAMIDSALGLDPQDMSEAAKAKRVLRGLADLSGITFAAKIRVEPANDPRYGDSNRLDRVVLPGEPEYRRIMDGEAVPARPSGARAPRPTAPAAAAPAWAPAGAATPAPARPSPGSAGRGQVRPARAGRDRPCVAERLMRRGAWPDDGGRRARRPHDPTPAAHAHVPREHARGPGPPPHLRAVRPGREGLRLRPRAPLRDPPAAGLLLHGLLRGGRRRSPCGAAA